MEEDNSLKVEEDKSLPNSIVHTEEIKKRYSHIEREIKRKLNELLLLHNLGWGKNFSRGLSITKDFKIRENSPQENPRFFSNPSTIKSSTIQNTVEGVRRKLIEDIDINVDNREIAEKYKEGVNQFIMDLKDINTRQLISLRHTYPKFIGYLVKANEEETTTRNVKLQVAKTLFKKFGDDAFSKDGLGNYILSDKSLDYLFTIFYNANEVVKQGNGNINDIFHDGDYPFIRKQKKPLKSVESEYIEVIEYLFHEEGANDFGNGEYEGYQKWLRSRLNYANILWALTNDQLGIDKTNFENNSAPEFKWDKVYNNLYTHGANILNDVIIDYNQGKNEGEKMKLSKRLKSMLSSVSKIIEGKKINDVVGFRISCRGIDGDKLEDVKQISVNRFERFNNDLKNHPEKYVDSGQTISIKEVSLDNKGVFYENQVNEIIEHLNQEINSDQQDNISFVKRNKSLESSFVPIEEWEKRMERYYPTIVNNPSEMEVLETVYNTIVNGVSRGKNGNYKDFKYNIIFEVKDKDGHPIGEYSSEVQFDDINNAIGLSNFNIRNYERWANRESIQSFAVSLQKNTRMCEYNIKEMQDWMTENTIQLPEEEREKFFQLDFTHPTPKKNLQNTQIKGTQKRKIRGRRIDNIVKRFKKQDEKLNTKIPDTSDTGQKIDISQFERKNEKNGKNINIAITEIINHFIRKGTFILCRKPGCKVPQETLLSVEDLYNQNVLHNLYICSIQELSSQQYSYLLQDWDYEIGVYLKNGKIGWISVGKLIDAMNLGKTKLPEFSAGI